jgi:EmrB/QacA subfamily drug resistance transporter
MSAPAPADAVPQSAAIADIERPSAITLTIYFSALVCMFLATLDMQIVVTALPTIAGELGNLHLFGWVGAAYLLATAAVSPIYGKLGDMFGRKVVLLFSIALFLIGSLTCGMAWSMESLIAARVLQGLGGGGLMVTSFAVIGELFEPRLRARYQGYSSAAFALSSVLGPVAGGTITEAFGWRWVFLVNLPIGIAIFCVIAWVMKSRPSGQRRRVDWAGGLLLAATTTMIVYWCDHAFDPAGVDIWTFILPVLGALGIAAFIAVERRAEEPVVPLSLFANRTISISIVLQVLAGMVTLGMFFYLALYIQTVTGLSPATVGMLFMPSSLCAMATSMLAGTIISRTGRYKALPIIGNLLGAAATFSFVAIDASTPLWLIALLMAFFGMSLGLSMQVLLVAVQHAAPPRDIGAATGLMTQSRTIGSSLGLAVNGAVLAMALSFQSNQLAPETATALQEGLAGLSPHGLAALPDTLAADVLVHYSNGFDTMFAFVTAVYIGAAALALLMPNVLIARRG